MAKEKEKEKVEVSAIDAETIEIVDSLAQKQKARRFFLIVKGSDIRKLVVFKKGNFTSRITEAKSSGFKGEVVTGVVSGKGQNLYFQIAGNKDVAAAMKVDGFSSSPPTKKSKLREFLKDNGLNYKPSYHIIQVAGDAADPDEESGVPAKLPPPGSEVGDDEQSTGQASKITASGASNDATGNRPGEPNSQSSNSSDDQKAILQQRVAALEPRFASALSQMKGDTSKIRMAMELAREKIQGENFADAVKILDRLTPIIDAALSDKAGKETDVIPENVVATRKKFIASRWQRAMEDVRAEIAKLQQAIASQLPDVDSEAIASGVSKGIDEFCDELNRTIIGTAQGDGNPSAIQSALTVVRKYRQLVATSEPLQFLANAKSELGVDVDVTNRLLSSLSDIEKSLST